MHLFLCICVSVFNIVLKSLHQTHWHVWSCSFSCIFLDELCFGKACTVTHYTKSGRSRATSSSKLTHRTNTNVFVLLFRQIMPKNHSINLHLGNAASVTVLRRFKQQTPRGPTLTQIFCLWCGTMGASVCLQVRRKLFHQATTAEILQIYEE